MELLQTVKQNLHKAYINTVNSVTPALSTSKFLQEGVLTPEEFVQAGDLLVHKCRTWSWEGGDPTKTVSYLPPDKQFLLTRKVPCLMRADSLLNSEKPIDIDVEGDDGWVATRLETNDASIPEISTTTKPTPTNTTTTTSKANEDDDEDSESIPDMETWDQENLVKEVDDPAELNQIKTGSSIDEDDNILKTRTYDLSLTYDKYYQTPKLWLFGYDENQEPLKPEQVFSDISQDHAHKTVTIDSHPHLGIPCAYIHPCKHASVMKKLLRRLEENGKELRVDQYIILFLKFMSAVIPTIEYDYTMSMEI